MNWNKKLLRILRQDTAAASHAMPVDETPFIINTAMKNDGSQYRILVEADAEAEVETDDDEEDETPSEEAPDLGEPVGTEKEWMISGRREKVSKIELGSHKKNPKCTWIMTRTGRCVKTSETRGIDKPSGIDCPDGMFYTHTGNCRNVVESLKGLEDAVAAAEKFQDHRTWYQSAKKDIDELMGSKEEAEFFTKIVAACSSSEALRPNIVKALKAYNTIRSGQDVSPGSDGWKFLNSQPDKIKRSSLVTVAELAANEKHQLSPDKQPKIAAFNLNLRGNMTKVTVDTHMFKFFYGSPGKDIGYRDENGNVRDFKGKVIDPSEFSKRTVMGWRRQCETDDNKEIIKKKDKQGRQLVNFKGEDECEGKWNAEATKAQIAHVWKTCEKVANKLGWKPAEAQAAIWIWQLTGGQSKEDKIAAIAKQNAERVRSPEGRLPKAKRYTESKKALSFSQVFKELKEKNNSYLEEASKFAKMAKKKQDQLAADRASKRTSKQPAETHEHFHMSYRGLNESADALASDPIWEGFMTVLRNKSRAYGLMEDFMRMYAEVAEEDATGDLPEDIAPFFRRGRRR